MFFIILFVIISLFVFPITLFFWLVIKNIKKIGEMTAIEHSVKYERNKLKWEEMKRNMI